MTKPIESDYTGHVAYTRALEVYCEGIEAELAKLKQQEPFGSINKNHLIETQEPWCREILLYSPNNLGDMPERRVLVYLAAGAQPVPEGMMLAPVEPTKAMLFSGMVADRAWQASASDDNGLGVIYKAMLAAAKEKP